MIQALKNAAVPILRKHNFAGSFPHFRRCLPEYTDLFTFQFDRNGGGFIIEIGRCPPGSFTTDWGKQILANKITTWDLHPKQRIRIQPRIGSGTDSWFRFDGIGLDVFARTATSVIPFLDQVERMFCDWHRS